MHLMNNSYVQVSVYNAQNIPSSIPHGRCGRGENVTDDVIILTQSNLATTHLRGWYHTLFYLS